MAETLNAVSGSGTQATTQSPQLASGQANAAAASAGQVQPGTAASVLTSSDGVALRGTALTTVSLGNSSAQTLGASTARTTTATTKALPAVNTHHFNPVLGGLTLVLCLVAVALFWLTARSAKNTTDYS